MQDVSCEPLMLCLSENPQASLDIFSLPHHHPAGSCIHRKAINKDKPTHPMAYCPPGSSIECGSILAHLLRRCTRLLMVLPSRQQSVMCSLVSYEEGSHITSIRNHSGAWRVLP